MEYLLNLVGYLWNRCRICMESFGISMECLPTPLGYTTAPPAPSPPKSFTQASRICDLVECLLNLVEYIPVCECPPYPILSHPISSYPTLSHPITSYPTLSHPIPSYPILSHGSSSAGTVLSMSPARAPGPGPLLGGRVSCQAHLWTVYGLSMDYLWTIYGLSMDYL